jgi:hypothetical protein
MPPLAPPGFSDEELVILREAARPLEFSRRAEFLELVAVACKEPRSPGAVLQAAAKVQRYMLMTAVGPRSARST